ncbi:hypothetical protein C8J57DRAFT_1492954 [Mycena rebaudengoi]|nr:hypothetical protein C8J57DRAFT_1492954 [Mycena rebaudengoi]
MPVIEARTSSETSSSNIGLIVAIVAALVILSLILLSFFTPLFKKLRARRRSYTGHRYSASSHLLGEHSSSSHAGHQLQSPDLPMQEVPVDEDDEYELGPRVEPRDFTSSPPLRVSIPQPPSIPTSHSSHVAPASGLPSAASSDSVYSARSPMPTVGLASPPPVPALPAHLRLPLTTLPLEEEPLSRGNTVVVAGLLKSRAKRLGRTATRSDARTSRIERANSIKEALSPIERSPTRPPLPMRTVSNTMDSPPNTSFAGTLDYYTFQSIHSPTESHSSDGTISDSDSPYDTDTPPLRLTKRGV